MLMRLNPSRILDAIGAVRNLPSTPNSGVDLCYTMNIFGSWDVGVWINADNNAQAADFVQRKIREITGVNDVYTIPTFPHSNSVRELKRPEDSKNLATA